MEKLEDLVLNTFVNAMMAGECIFDKDDVGSLDKSDDLMFEYSSSDRTMTISYFDNDGYTPILKIEVGNVDPSYAAKLAYFAVKEWIK